MATIDKIEKDILKTKEKIAELQKKVQSRVRSAKEVKRK